MCLHVLFAFLFSLAAPAAEWKVVTASSILQSAYVGGQGPLILWWVKRYHRRVCYGRYEWRFAPLSMAWGGKGPFRILPNPLHVFFLNIYLPSRDLRFIHVYNTIIWHVIYTCQKYKIPLCPSYVAFYLTTLGRVRQIVEFKQSSYYHFLSLRQREGKKKTRNSKLGAVSLKQAFLIRQSGAVHNSIHISANLALQSPTTTRRVIRHQTYVTSCFSRLR